MHAALATGDKNLFNERNLSNTLDFDGISDRISVRHRAEINRCLPLCLRSIKYKIFAVACGENICLAMTGI